MKRVVILGSTGSIGTQTLDVMRQRPDFFQVVGLSAATRGSELRAQAAEWGVQRLALLDETAAREHGVPGGLSGLVDLATLPEADIVVVAVAGVIGLEPTLAAIQAGKTVALASKEVLVAAGEFLMPLARERGVPVLPIDSEHSALFQCVQGYRPDQIHRLILTASGGPFRGKRRADLEHVTVEQALNHPTWRMGGKITVDSATLMNKGLETIEAKWLFEVPMDRIDAVVHPQSVIHSLVELADGSVLGQLGWPDMRLPIQVALTYPERLDPPVRPWSPLDSPRLDFEPIDAETFRCLALAREAGARGGLVPCAMNAADEVAAAAFLAGQLAFLAIADVVEEVMSACPAGTATLEAVLEVDRWARVRAQEGIDRRPAPTYG